MPKNHLAKKMKKMKTQKLIAGLESSASESEDSDFEQVNNYHRKKKLPNFIDLPDPQRDQLLAITLMKQKKRIDKLEAMVGSIDSSSSDSDSSDSDCSDSDSSDSDCSCSDSEDGEPKRRRKSHKKAPRKHHDCDSEEEEEPVRRKQQQKRKQPKKKAPVRKPRMQDRQMDKLATMIAGFFKP